MQAVREITVEETGSELEYNSFQEIDELRREMRAEVLARQLEDETSSGCCALSCSWYRCVKVVFLTTVIALIWAAMASPSIIYIREVAFPSDKSSSTPSNPPSTCVREEYNGTTCRHYLASLQSCIDNDDTNMTDSRSIFNKGNPIYIAPQEDQAEQEGVIDKLLHTLDAAQRLGFVTVSEECMKRLEPFACLHLFPLISCDNGTGNGTVYRPSSRQCMLLRDNVCQELWTLAVSSGFGNNLPDCSKEEEDPPLDLLEDCQGEVDISISNTSVPRY